MKLLSTRATETIHRRGANVSSTPVGVSATVRAKWLAETAEALAHATSFLKQVKPRPEDDAAFAELMLRIRAATREVELLRAGRPPRGEIGPKWNNLPPWDEAGPHA